MKTVLFTVALLCIIAGCTVSPTGRQQLMLFSQGQMSQMGITAFSEMKKEQKLDSRPSVNRYVQCISNALLQHVPPHMQQQQWEVSVFNDESPNAFALPGAKIGVHTGMLTIADTPSQLAAVIGHEIGHVWANHGNERMSQQTIASTGLQVVSILAGEPTQEKKYLMSALGLVTQGTVLKFSRTHEKEADIIGLEIMAKAGFDPREAVTLWQDMAKNSGGNRPPEFMSTHPSEQTRIRKLTYHLPNVMPFYEQAKASGKTPKCS